MDFSTYISVLEDGDSDVKSTFNALEGVRGAAQLLAQWNLLRERL